MQNATIQINAMSGMGDIFCDIYIAVIIANAFKKEDCNTDLKFYWGPHPVDNKKIFDDSFFDNFNSVETINKPITEIALFSSNPTLTGFARHKIEN